MQDYHIHSSFSGDSDMSMDDACKKAINLGIKEIAFTDHIDLYWPGPIKFEIIDLKQYASTIKGFQEKYQEKLTVKLGVELGIQPHSADETKILIAETDLDYIIASIHCVDGMDICEERFFNQKTPYQAYFRYFEEVLHMVESFEPFSVLGHLDVIRRYYPNPEERNINYRDFAEIIDNIFISLIRKNKGIEINTSGFRYGLESFLPSLDFLKRYRQLGGEIVTIGSDAHTPDFVGYKLDQAIDMIKESGFRYITGFNKLEPSFIKI